MKPVGECRLCLTVTELVDSHFISKSAFKRVRGVGDKPDPIIIQSDGVSQRSHQITDYVFCHECEQRFHRCGEDTFFRYCYSERRFKLATILQALTPVTPEDDQSAFYALPTSEHQALQQIGFLGVSIFWKAAVHRWTDQGHVIPPVQLEPYTEEFRLFLHGDAPFPEHAALTIEVSPPENRFVALFGTPTTMTLPTNQLHWIDICGIRFHLYVGEQMPVAIKQWFCVFNLQGQRVIRLAKQKEAEMERTYANYFAALTRWREDRTP